MDTNIIERILTISESDTNQKIVRYANKPYFNDLKRVYRIAKRIPNKEKEKSIGYFLGEIKKVQGSTVNMEKIIREVFGKKMKMTPKAFISALMEYDLPQGEFLQVKPETAYQTTQRAVPDAKINKTLNVSLYGDILKEPLDRYIKKDPNFNEVFRTLYRHMSSSHFQESAAFIRYSEFTDDWLHFDAFQTDYFNKLRKAMHNEQHGGLAEEFIKELEAKEIDFYKTAVSYVVRTHPKVKVFTANTAEIVKRVENVRGEGKLLQLYLKLPKALGFKLISLNKLLGIFATRPGKAEEIKKKFAIKGFAPKSTKDIKVPDTTFGKITTQVITKIKDTKEKGEEITNQRIAQFITSTLNLYLNDQDVIAKMDSAYHQHINLFNQFLEKKTTKKNLNELVKGEFEKQVKVKIDDNVEIWWANRGTIFEESEIKTIKRLCE